MFKIFRLDINLVTRILVLSDFFLFFSNGLLSPIYAIFVLDHVKGSSLEIIGLATAIYWVSRVVSVIPLSRLMDKIKGEKDEYYFMLIGTMMIASLPLGYIFVTQAWQIYLIQILNGIAFSMIIPAWRVIFTKNLNHDRVSYEWSLDDVGVGIATAISAAAGAAIAQKFGFDILFIFIFVIGFSSVLVLLLIYKGEGSFVEWLRVRRGGPDKKNV
jgi:MFS family permease